MTCPLIAPRDTTDGTLIDRNCFNYSPFLVDLEDSKENDIEEIDDKEDIDEIGVKDKVLEDINFEEKVEESSEESCVDEVLEITPGDSVHDKPLLAESQLIIPSSSTISSPLLI